MNDNIIPSDTKYIPLTQQKYCCVPTCIQMVMLRNNIPLVAAELIGYEMGLIVSDEDRHLFWNPRTGERPPAGYGTQASKAEYDPNTVFKKLNIPLKMKWSLINKFESLQDFKSYLEEFQNTDKDVLACFDWGKLFDKDYQGGHVCVLDKVDLEKNIIRLVDPDFHATKWQEVSIEKMFMAMKFHGQDKSAGFWELEINR